MAMRARSPIEADPASPRAEPNQDAHAPNREVCQLFERDFDTFRDPRALGGRLAKIIVITIITQGKIGGWR